MPLSPAPTADEMARANASADFLEAQGTLKRRKISRADYIDQHIQAGRRRIEADRVFAVAQAEERARLATMSAADHACMTLTLAEMNDTDHSHLVIAEARKHLDAALAAR